MTRFLTPTRFCRARASLIPRDERRSPETHRQGGRLSDAYTEAITIGWRESLVVHAYLEQVRSERNRHRPRPAPPAGEDAFVAVAASFGRRYGIDYATWREFGVAASVLARAAIRG